MCDDYSCRGCECVMVVVVRVVLVGGVESITYILFVPTSTDNISDDGAIHFLSDEMLTVVPATYSHLVE